MPRLVTVALVIAILSAQAQSQPEIPDTPAGRVFAKWLSVFNEGAPRAILAFDAENRQRPESINRTMVLRATTGGFAVVRVERSEPHTLSVLVQENFSEQLESVELVLDPTTSRINTLDVRPTSRPPDLAIPRLNQARALAALRTRASIAASADEFSGVLLVARGDRVLLEQAWGYADRESRVLVTPETQFSIASTAKMFEAVATLQLVEAGRLRLDDVVGRHMPEYENKDVASKVTIRHLLMHTGGTGDMPPEDVRKTLRTNSDYVRVLSARPPLFEPGSEYQYSNYGFILLAALIERVSGFAFEEYVQRRIFTPAGMRSTRIGVAGQPAPALGYSRRKGEMTRVVNPEPFPVFSTARDLLSFARAFQGGKFISPALLREATAVPPSGQRYGYGLMLWRHGSVESFGHGGTSAGVNADVRIVPSSGYVAIALSNIDYPAASRLVDFFLNRMPDVR